MLSTVEAIVDQSGQISWLEPVQIEGLQKILVTFLETPSNIPTVTLDEVAGCLAYQGNSKSLEDMEREVAERLKNERSY